jgi:hypothetical protein
LAHEVEVGAVASDKTHRGDPEDEEKTLHHKGHEGRTKYTKGNTAIDAAPASPLVSSEDAGDVVEIAGGEWLVSRRAGNGHFQLVRSNDSRGAVSVATDANADVVQPVLQTARTVPNRHPSALHDWNYANLLCLNAYTSKYKFADGAIKSVRLYTVDSHNAEKLLGSAAVEKDGSFYLRTPADQPLKVELADGNGKILKREAGWFWLRKGEQRICVGCHAGPETAPENVVPLVLQRSVIATDLTGGNTQAVQGGH